MSLKLSLVSVPGAPLYAQAATAIRSYVEEAALKPGAPLPSELELADSLEVSRVTLRRAVDELVRAHVLIRRQGVGTFVGRGRLVQPLADLQSTRDLASRNDGEFEEYTSVILDHEVGRATRREAELLALRPKAAVMRFTRVDSNRGEVFGIARFSIPKIYGRHFTAEALNERSSYQLFADLLEIHPERATQSLRAERAGPEAASLLGLEVDDPVFEVERVTFDLTGSPIEWGVITYRYDAMEFNVELSKGAAAHLATGDSSINSTVSAAFRQDERATHAT